MLQEFLKLEGAAARSKVEYESMLAAEREKVLGYEALEMELDSAVNGARSRISRQ